MTQPFPTNSSEYSRAEMHAICERQRAIIDRVRSVNPLAALEAPDVVDPDVFWAALALVALRKDLYDGLAHVRAIHDTVQLRVDALACVLAADRDLVARLGARADAAIADRSADEIFLVWSHACIDDDTWEILRAARVQLRR